MEESAKMLGRKQSCFLCKEVEGTLNDFFSAYVLPGVQLLTGAIPIERSCERS